MVESTMVAAPVEVPQVDTPHRRIVTPLPVPESIALFERLERTEARSMHGQLPVIWDRADGIHVYDPWGNMWLDFTSTICVANAGHGHPAVVEAIRHQIDRPLLHTYTFAHAERVAFLEYLIAHTPSQFEKAFLVSAGSEAVEASLKLMRLHGQAAGKRRGGVLCIEGNWHGRTLGAQMMASNPAQREWIGYHDPNLHHLPFPFPWVTEIANDPVAFFRKSLEELEQTHGLDPTRDLCGVMLETYQGWGGFFYPPEFVLELVRFAREHDLLVTFDEVQSGFGRTGELFGYMHYGVEPDIICCGKGASSSVPLAFVMGSRKIMDLPEFGSMSSTHSANPLACAAGRASFEVLLNEGLIDNSRSLGARMHERLQALPLRHPQHIRSVEGRGLMAGIIFYNEDGSSGTDLCNQMCERAMQRGLLVVKTGRESIKLTPPLNIDEAALFEGIEVLEEVVNQVIDDD